MHRTTFKKPFLLSTKTIPYVYFKWLVWTQIPQKSLHQFIGNDIKPPSLSVHKDQTKRPTNYKFGPYQVNDRTLIFESRSKLYLYNRQ